MGLSPRDRRIIGYTKLADDLREVEAWRRRNEQFAAEFAALYGGRSGAQAPPIEDPWAGLVEWAEARTAASRPWW